jgi:hypothetical protein
MGIDGPSSGLASRRMGAVWRGRRDAWSGLGLPTTRASVKPALFASRLRQECGLANCSLSVRLAQVSRCCAIWPEGWNGCGSPQPV